MLIKLLIFILSIYQVLLLEEKTAALILARGGSKGIRLKNLQIVGGITLLGRSILTAKNAGIDDVTVSTDHPIIALEALKYNVSVFKRCSTASTDWAPSLWAVLEFIERRSNVTTLVLLQATSPFIQAKHLRSALIKLNEPTPFDCVFSVTRSHKLRWDCEKFLPLNFDVSNRPRRQDWNGEFVESGAFYVTRTSLLRQGYLQNSNNIMSYNIDEVTFEDLEATDVISVELVPERKGLILKHCEYYVSSRRHGTTVTRRYNDFALLYDVLYAKYPYRAVCSLPPKRVVVGGGSPMFLQRRRAALQRWLTIVARHPVLAHDADLRTFLCETSPKLDKPKHDEFVLAGTQDNNIQNDITTEEMQNLFATEQEQLRLAHLGLARLFKIFEKVESRCEAERADIRELGAALHALSAPADADNARWTTLKEALKSAADLTSDMGDLERDTDEGMERMLIALDAVGGHRRLCGRLQRGLHAERAAAAAAAPPTPAARTLQHRHRYALRAALQEGRVARAYALSALEALPELLRTQSATHARVAALWADLHTVLRHPHSKPHVK